MSADLSQELIKQIAEGSGRCYNYEGKRMAQEILRRRAAEEAAAKAAAATQAAPTLYPPTFP